MIRPPQPPRVSLSQDATVEKRRQETHRLLYAMTTRLRELEATAEQAMAFDVFAIDRYDGFKSLFLTMRTQCEEFQALSRLTQDSINALEELGRGQWAECTMLQNAFHKLQVPLLRAVIQANLRLLRVWADQLKQGEGLPLGSQEIFLETVHTIHATRSELLRPRYLALLDDAALEDADQTEQLLQHLVGEAPALFAFPATTEKDPWARLDDFFAKLRQRNPD